MNEEVRLATNEVLQLEVIGEVPPPAGTVQLPCPVSGTWLGTSRVNTAQICAGALLWLTVAEVGAGAGLGKTKHVLGKERGALVGDRAERPVWRRCQRVRDAATEVDPDEPPHVGIRLDDLC